MYAGCRVVSDDDLSVAFDQFLKCRSTPAGPLFICQQPEIGLSRFLLAGHEGFGSAEQDSAAELGGGEFLVGPMNAPPSFSTAANCCLVSRMGSVGSGRNECVVRYTF